MTTITLKGEDRKKFIQECVDKDMTFRQMADLLGISYQRVSQIYNNYNYKPVEELKNWCKRKRKYLGLPLEVSSKNGGLDFVRDVIRNRDNHTCQKCFRVWEEGKRKFDVHHLDIKMESKKDINYDRNNMDKMITLCHKCHLNLHTVREKMRKPYRNRSRARM